MGYMCTTKAEWVIGVDICICYDEKLLEDLSKEQFGVKYKRYKMVSQFYGENGYNIIMRIGF